MGKDKGDKYECKSCGLVVVVDNPCDCGDACEIMCCEQPMKKVAKPKTKSTTTAKKS